jgi:predicted lipase
MLSLDPTFSADSFEMVGGRNGETAEMLIIRGDDVTILSLRGSDEIEDWFKNINVMPRRSQYGTMLGGFQCEAEKLIDICLAEYDRAGAVYFTGHSKGGGEGICLMNMIRVRRSGVKIRGAYFFGCPRALGVGTADKFTQAYRGRVFRVVNNNDIVCRVPPHGTYGHVNPGSRAYISRNNKLWLGKVDPWRLRYDRFMGRVDAWKSGCTFDGLHDHYPMDKRYVSKLL